MKTLLILVTLILGVKVVTSCNSKTPRYNVLVEVEYLNNKIDTFALDDTKELTLFRSGVLGVYGEGVLRDNVRSFKYLQKTKVK